MPPGSVTDPPSGSVFTDIERRLRERYRISINAHLGDVVVAEATGKFDPSMGGAFPSLGGPREKTLPGSVKSGKFLEGKTILQGITFPPRNFQELLELFRVAANSRGQSAFHYHPLKPAPGGGKIAALLNKAEQLAYGDLLGLSYDQTTVGLTKATEQRAWGFREIADTYNIEVGPVQAATTSTQEKTGTSSNSVRRPPPMPVGSTLPHCTWLLRRPPATYISTMSASCCGDRDRWSGSIRTLFSTWSTSFSGSRSFGTG